VGDETEVKIEDPIYKLQKSPIVLSLFGIATSSDDRLNQAPAVIFEI